MSSNVEADPFFQLLTDALRAGPGSPQWRQALSKLRADGPEADEYRLLCEAREHLASGNSFRSVRAGPEFTRKLFQNLNEHAGQRRPVSAATIVAIGSALVILGVLGIVAYLLTRGGQAGRNEIEDLAGNYFSANGPSASFEGGVPEGWRIIGELPLDFSNGLRAGASAQKSRYSGGGVVIAEPLSAAGPFEVQALVAAPPGADAGVVEVFVSDSSDFSQDRATSPREVVWLLKGNRPAVVVNGQSQVAGAPVEGTVRVRIAVGRDVAIVNADGTGKPLWSGVHGLAPEQPRYVGVRFIRGELDKGGSAIIQSIRVQRKAGAAGGAS